MREYSRLNRLKNIEKRREYDRQYVKKNRARKTKKFREWRHKNPHKAKEANTRHYEYQQQWLRDHSELTAHHAAKRRASRKKQTPPWVDETHLEKIKEIYRSAKTRSAFHEVPFHVDHIEPLKGVNEKGEHVSSGLHVWWNLRVITAEENLKKSNKLKLK